jgi:N-acetylglutamate synthase-like GNAT family acetyltransferase
VNAIVRAARRADLPAIAALLERSGLPVNGVADHLEHFEVAGEGEAVAAVCGLERHEPEALLRSLAVAPERRGRGLGASMVGRAEERARALGLARLWLLTETAQSWFERLGWSPVPRAGAPAELAASAEFQGACPATAVLMTRELTVGRAPGP